MTPHATRRIGILVCTCLAAVASLSAAPAEPRGAPAPLVDLRQENAELRRQVAALNAKIAVLEGQLALLKRQPGPNGPNLAVPNVPKVPNPFNMPGAEHRLDGPRPDWVPRQFNGQRFYLIPCETGQATAAQANAPWKGAAGTTVLTAPAQTSK